jgi:hypothetical protein
LGIAIIRPILECRTNLEALHYIAKLLQFDDILVTEGLMALLDDILNGWSGSIFVGLGAVVALPLLLPLVGAVVRPVAKLAIQGGLYVAETLQELVAQGGEQVSDVVAEAQAEYTTNGNGAV